MMNTLIVEDEVMILEGIGNILKKNYKNEMSIFQATNGFEALDILQSHKIDIVISDIRMPMMSGIELQKQIFKRWPRCKVIFLSGFSDVEDLRSAIRYGAAEYVMKTEGYEKILEVVDNTMISINVENAKIQALIKSNQVLLRAKPLLWKKHLMELLQNEKAQRESIKHQFRLLDIPLNPEQPVYLAILKIDKWRDGFSVSDQSLMLFAIENIANEYFINTALFVSIENGTSKLYWFIQPLSNVLVEYDGREILLKRLSSIQHTCKELLQLSVSFIVSSKAVQWEDVYEKMNRLINILNFGLRDEEALQFDSDILDQSKLEITGSMHVSHSPYTSYKKKLNQLENLLENNNADEFFSLLQDFANENSDGSKPHSHNLELFHSLGTMVLSYINKRNLAQILSASFDLEKLSNSEKHRNWEETIQYFHSIAQHIFQYEQRNLSDYQNEVISKIQKYILDHLEGDLTLVKLSDIAFLNPSYLSRIYKQKTGENLSEFIMNAKIAKAKELLGEPRNKVQDIVAAIGFETHSYFTQFFKKQTGLTPEQYRKLNTHD